MAILYSKDLTTAKKKLPPVGLDLVQEIISGLGANFVQTVKNSIVNRESKDLKLKLLVGFKCHNPLCIVL